MKMGISKSRSWRASSKKCYIAPMPPAFRKKEALFFFALFLLVAAAYYYRLVTGGFLYAPGDGWLQNFPLRAFYSAQLKSFRIPLWNPYEFAGIPYIGVMQTGALYPLNVLLYFLLRPETAYNFNIIVHYALAGFFTYIYLRECGSSRLASFTAGLLFPFAGYLATISGDTAIQETAVWLPLVLYLAERMKKKPGIKQALALCLAVSAQILAGNFQILMYSMLVFLFYCLYLLPEVQKEARGRFALLLGLALVLAALISAVQIWPTLELSHLSVRDHIANSLGAFFSHAYHVYPKNLASAVFPFLYGGDIGSKVATREDSMGFYTGILPLALAIAAAVKGFKASRRTRFWALVGAVSLVLSLGTMTPLGALLVHMPVYGLFRAHGRNIFELSFAAAVLFAEGIDGALTRRGDSRLAMILLCAVPASLAALLVLKMLAHPDYLGAFTPGNPAITFTLIISVLYIICLALFEKMNVKPFFWAALLIAGFEIYRFFAPYGISGKPLPEVKNACVDSGYAALGKPADGAPSRVMNLFTQELVNVPCGRPVFNSYDQLEPDDFAYLADVDPISYSLYSDELLSENSLLSMASVKWIAVDTNELSRLGKPLTSGLAASSAPFKETQLGSDSSPKILPPPDDSKKDTLDFSPGINAGPGTYLLTVEAKALQNGASLRVEFSDEGKPYRVKTIPLYVYPGVLDSGPRVYNRTLFHTDAGPVFLFFSAPLGKQVEITDITLSKLEPGGPLPILVASGQQVYQKEFEVPGRTYFKNLNALPRAYMVQKIVPAETIEKTKYLFETNQINPANEATVASDEIDGNTPATFSGGEARITHYGLQSVNIMASAGQAGGFLVLADQFYPGWKAYIDGRGAKIYRANGIMRGVIVPPGAHKIRFVYRPYVFYALSILSGLTVMACLGVLMLPRRK